MIQAIDDIGLDTNTVLVPKLKTTANTNIDLFDNNDEHVTVHVLIPSKNTSTHYAGTPCNFGEKWKPHVTYGYLEVLGM